MKQRKYCLNKPVCNIYPSSYRFLHVYPRTHLKHLEDFNELANILNQPIFQKDFDKAKEANLTPEEKDDYEESLKSYRDNINVIDTAREECIQKGREEEKIKIAKNLLDVLENDVIALKTGLTIEAIEVLRK